MSDKLETVADTLDRPSIAIRDDVSIVHVAVRRGMRAILDERAQATLGAALPAKPRAVDAPRATIVWAGPDQWLIIKQQSDGADPFNELSNAFKGLATVVEVSDSRVLVRVVGPRAREALSRGMAIDLHDRVFKPGDVAITHASHLGVTLWRLPDRQRYDMLCARTYSGDFLGWLRRICNFSSVTI